MAYDRRRDNPGFGGDDHRGGRGRGYGGQGNRRGGPAPGPRPTEATVTLNYNKLSIDPACEVGMDFYKVEIKSAAFKPKLEDGNKILDDSGRVVREFTARESSVSADDKFKKRFFSSMKPWLIYKQLCSDQQQEDPSFDLFVSCVW